MQIRFALAAATLVLASSVAAAVHVPASGSEIAARANTNGMIKVVARDVDGAEARDALAERALSKAQVKSKVATVAAQYSKTFAADIKQIEALTAQSAKLSASTVKTLIAQVEKHAGAATAEFATLKKLAKDAGLSKRAPALDLNKTVDTLIKILDQLTPALNKLLRRVNKELGLNLVNNLLRDLKPTLTALYFGLEGLLRALGGTLTVVLIPVVDLLNALTTGLLGLNLE